MKHFQRQVAVACNTHRKLQNVQSCHEQLFHFEFIYKALGEGKECDKALNVHIK